MALSNVSSFLQTIGQGVKPNMFLVDVQFPDSLSKGGEDLNLTNILCKSAALPGSNLGVIEVPFRGRTVKIAGDRTFDTWSATFFNDKDFKLRAFFEEWANNINTHEANTSPLFTPSTTSGYMADLSVKQLEKDASEEGSILREYTLKYCFPTNVSPIDLAYDSNDQIEEFTVEWQYSYFTAQAGSRDGVSGIGVV
ncbi:tail tube [Synechococcus phage ACG-2014j]|jgi:hypothetical protein|uniref:Tail tube protein n=2 Tax=Potamoivirus TaxID=2948872 RepID=A0A1D8KL07_9CAUD|nr:tail tube [Synechococcus phage ACG-2014j]YP_009320558.1 tail tube [Synechococcus phage S-CAM4]YP_010355501.1 tail tube [Synechococcus phage ACG-2014j]AIX24013.1 tail tube monomer protein [Synechococcus phage ACG-2014j]AIX28456.1 tail tube monomer protein [Synechococcus phage ACG-2014j]AOV59348.1 tail tube protein [Synechococcus phage S-CAM4]AOV59586.1 tail tube protein [Synechococcus phage S-CAM4]AOV59824.1 tail tube protein [Synechococcus phage S-CAM4]